jgi:hypothetical protein
MKMHHTLVPAIASLTLLVANPASALTPAWTAPQIAGVEGSTGNIVLAKKMSKWFYKCNNNAGDMAAIQRCYQMHGLNSNGHKVKSGM